MTIVPKAWREGILDQTTNIDSGFRASGMCPLYFLSMLRQLEFLYDSGITDSEENPYWMRCWETVRTEMLSLPPEIY